MKKLFAICLVLSLVFFATPAHAENILNLTNNSGDAVTSGMLVILDVSADDSFTTTTAAFHPLQFGVIPFRRGGVSISIADGAKGPVQITGVATITCDEAISLGTFVSTASTAGQGTGDSLPPNKYIGVAVSADVSAPYQPSVLILSAGTSSSVSSMIIRYSAPSDVSSIFSALDIEANVGSLDATSVLHIIDIVATGSTSGTVAAIGVHDDIAPIHQHIGTFATPEQSAPNSYAGKYPDGGSYAAGIDGETLFEADDDEIYLGQVSVFSALEVILSTGASIDETLIFEYQNSDTSWDAFIPIDGTSGFRQTGTIIWESSDLTDWKTDSDPGGTDSAAGYWIRIRRTKNNVLVDSVCTTIKIMEPSLYGWFADASIIAKSITLDDAMSHADLGNLVAPADDHSQYHNDTRGDIRYLYRENAGAFTPDGDYEPATKKYVDDNIGSSAQLTDTFTNGSAVQHTANTAVLVDDGTADSFDDDWALGATHFLGVVAETIASAASGSVIVAGVATVDLYTSGFDEGNFVAFGPSGTGHTPTRDDSCFGIIVEVVDADTAKVILTHPLHTGGSSGAGDSNFAIDSSFPGSPTAGELFYHTSHDTLFEYEGGWEPLFNYGSTLALYVDDGAGTDQVGNGYAAAADALATIQYCWDHCIPRFFNGTITVNVKAGTYAETVALSGKTPASGTAEIIFLGELTNGTSGTASAGSTSTLTDTGETWATNEFQRDLLRLTGGTGIGQYAWIESNTDAEVATIAGLFTTAPDDTTEYSIDAIATIVNGSPSFTLDKQKGITFQYIKCSSATGLVYVYNYSEASLIAVQAAGVTAYGAIQVRYNSILQTDSEAIYIDDPSSVGLAISYHSQAPTITRMYIRDCGGNGMQVGNFSYAYPQRGMWDNNATYGIKCSGMSMVSFAAGVGANTIKNEGIGVYVIENSFGANTTTQTYSGCSTDYDADASSTNS